MLCQPDADQQSHIFLYTNERALKLTSLIDLINGTLLVERANLELDIQGAAAPT